MEEGIMGLPQASMQNQQQPMVYSSADAYDAALTAADMINPNTSKLVRQSIQQTTAGIEITPEQLDLMIELVEELINNPSNYPQLRKELIEEAGVSPSDIPEQFDIEFLSTFLITLNEVKMARTAGAMAPMEAEPVMQGMPPTPMAKGGLADVGRYLASKGRYGDTMLAHITPEEAAMLRRYGGSGTTNPETGLPEFGWLSKRWKDFKQSLKKNPVVRVVATVALATVLGPAIAATGLMSTAAATAVAGGVAGAGVTLAAGGSIKEALVAGTLGYFGGGGTIGGFSPLAEIGKILPGAATSALNKGLAMGVLGTGIGKLSGMSFADAAKLGLTAGAGAGIGAYLQGAPFMGDAAAQAGAEAGAGAGASQQGAPISEAGQVPAQSPVSQTPPTGPIQAIEDVGLAADQVRGTSAPAPDSAPAPNTLPYDYYTGPGEARIGTIPSPRGGAPISSIYTPPSPSSSVIQAQPAPEITASRTFIPEKGIAPVTEYDALSVAPKPVTGPTSLSDKVISGVKDLYNEYVSPDRASAAGSGVLTKYAPLAVIGLGTTALAGGFKTPPTDTKEADKAQAYWDEATQRAKDRQAELDRLGYGFTKGVAKPRQPTLVATPDYSSIPVSGIPVYQPPGITNQPGGIPQPYNVAGLYNVPQIYSPQRAATGGEMKRFPRRTGPINGPGTGTSDSIPAMLSDGEFVFTAKAVRNAGGGSRRKGAAKMYKLMKMLEGGPVGRNA